MRNTFSQKFENICTHSLEKYKTPFSEISTLFHTEYPISLNKKPENVQVIWIQQQEILPYGTGGIVFAELVWIPGLHLLVHLIMIFSNAVPLLCLPDRQQGQHLRHPGGWGPTKRFGFYLIRIKFVAKNPCNSCCFKLTFHHRWWPTGGSTRSLPSASLGPRTPIGKLCNRCCAMI